MIEEPVLSDEFLEELAKKIELPEKHDFHKLEEGSYFCTEPVRISEREMVVLEDISPDGIVVRNLNLPDTLNLIQKINESGKFDKEIRLGNSKENRLASRNKDYRSNVLSYSVWTGEVARPMEDAYSVCGVYIPPKNGDVPLQVLVDKNGKSIKAVVDPKIRADRPKIEIRYAGANNLMKKIPTCPSAMIRDFEVIPSDEHVDPNGEIVWAGSSYSGDGVGAMMCDCLGKGPLTYQLRDPLSRHNKAIPIFTSSLS